jgi:hypothetical protein
MPTRLQARVVRKTANYTINAGVDRSGTVFTNGGASGAVVFTLPAPKLDLLGTYYKFVGLVNEVITVATATADTLVGFNDVDLDSIATGGTGERIGAWITVYCVESAAGTYVWVAEAGTNGVTYALTD